MSYDLSTLSSMKRHWLLRNSNIPRRFLGLDTSDVAKVSGEFPPTIDDWLTDVLSGIIIKKIGGLGTTGVGLLLDGGPGIGKTTHAVVTAMEFIRRLPEDDESARNILQISSSDYGMNCRPIYYMTYPEFLSKKKSTFDADHDEKREMMDDIEGLHGRSVYDWLNARVLVIDDLGKEYGSKYDDSSFDEILRARYDKSLPTIVTTNVKLENWEVKYSEAMASFAHEAFVRVPIVGSDQRGAK
ncbi:MAG: hypothetical protein EBT07_01655 [Actinobacteria bacterium]|jgi:DNA replication protein DnaC|nr:hypothetical protein [Actinomycetota bacterium]